MKVARGSETPKLPPSPARILLVEDNLILATSIERFLIHEGYEVVGIATSGDEALALAERHRPHLALMDIRLPWDRDGVETAILLKKRHGIRSIFTTAHGEAEVRARAAEAE